MKTNRHLLAFLAIAIGSTQLHAGLPTIKTATPAKVTAAAPRVVVPPKVTIVKAPVVKVPVVKAPVVPKIVAAPRVPAFKAPAAPKSAPKAVNPSAGLAAASKLGQKPSGTRKLFVPAKGGASSNATIVGICPPPGGSSKGKVQGPEDPRTGIEIAKKIKVGGSKPQKDTAPEKPAKEPKKPSEKPAKDEPKKPAEKTEKPDPKAEDTPQTQEEYEAWKKKRAEERRAQREAEERREKEEANS